jgi:hypothetical protein
MTDAVAFTSPTATAAALLDAHGADPAWLDRFAEALDHRRRGRELERVLAVWGLSHTEAGALFGVTRQALTKWLRAGVPAERAAAVADVAAATDLLVHHLKRERIPAVVRRDAPSTGSRSLLDVLRSGDTSQLLALTRAMFAFGDAHT